MFDPPTAAERAKAEELWNQDYPWFSWPPSSVSSFSTYIRKAREALEREKARG